MVVWTRARKKACIRNSDGTFKRWKGGKKKSELKKKENLVKGIKIHIGKEFVRQHKRIAKVGDIVRTKKSDGTFHKGAFWYIRTKKGWRRYGKHKPSKVARAKARKGIQLKSWRSRRKTT